MNPINLLKNHINVADDYILFKKEATKHLRVAREILQEMKPLADELESCKSRSKITAAYCIRVITLPVWLPIGLCSLYFYFCAGLNPGCINREDFKDDCLTPMSEKICNCESDTKIKLDIANNKIKKIIPFDLSPGSHNFDFSPTSENIDRYLEQIEKFSNVHYMESASLVWKHHPTYKKVRVISNVIPEILSWMFLNPVEHTFTARSLTKTFFREMLVNFPNVLSDIVASYILEVPTDIGECSLEGIIEMDEQDQKEDDEEDDVVCHYQYQSIQEE